MAGTLFLLPEDLQPFTLYGFKRRAKQRVVIFGKFAHNNYFPTCE